MKTALILAMLLPQPEGLREKPETVCVTCCGRGWAWYVQKIAGLRLPMLARCWNCDGYGKERTLYGSLLNDGVRGRR